MHKINYRFYCHALYFHALQGSFPTQGSNLHLLRLLYWQASSLQLAPPGKPVDYTVLITKMESRDDIFQLKGKNLPIVALIPSSTLHASFQILIFNIHVNRFLALPFYKARD